MKILRKYIRSTAIIAAITVASTMAPAHALGDKDPHQKNNIGTYTVKCHVHKNAPGNPVVGYVVGDHSKDPKLAEKDADLFVSKFGDNLAKRHCKTQKRYISRGAYNTAMQPL